MKILTSILDRLKSKREKKSKEFQKTESELENLKEEESKEFQKTESELENLKEVFKMRISTLIYNVGSILGTWSCKIRFTKSYDPKAEYILNAYSPFYRRGDTIYFRADTLEEIEHIRDNTLKNIEKLSKLYDDEKIKERTEEKIFEIQ